MFDDAEADLDTDNLLGATIKAISGAERRAQHLGAVLQADLERGGGGGGSGRAEYAEASSDRLRTVSAPSERRAAPPPTPPHNSPLHPFHPFHPHNSPLAERRSGTTPARSSRGLTRGQSSVERAMDEMAKALL